MIIPMVCFTCGQTIAHEYVHYLELIEKYKSQQIKMNEKNIEKEEPKSKLKLKSQQK
mgnify:FL=1